jgi:hypothetical protein
VRFAGLEYGSVEASRLTFPEREILFRLMQGSRNLTAEPSRRAVALAAHQPVAELAFVVLSRRHQFRTLAPRFASTRLPNDCSGLLVPAKPSLRSRGWRGPAIPCGLVSGHAGGRASRRLTGKICEKSTSYGDISRRETADGNWQTRNISNDQSAFGEKRGLQIEQG